MLIGSIPTKIPTPFADGAVSPYIRPVPIPSQQTIQAGAASFTDGFPPDTFNPVGAGGTPPFGADFNGLLNQMSAWSRWVQAGAPIAYDSAFQTAISGYPLGAFVASAVTFGLYFISTADGNTTNPDTGGAGWLPVPLGSGGVLTTGAWTWRPTQETLPGWTKANATTIGNTGSGAAQLADPTAAAQFAWLWTNFSNTQCPVSGGRGANPAADFAALKTIQTLNMKGIGILGMDTMGGSPSTVLNGVPVVSGAATQAGSILGEVLHTLLTTELALHNHGINDSGHSHGYSDPGHTHTATTPFGVAIVTPQTFSVAGGTGLGAAALGLSTNTTGITISSATTGITTQNNGSSIGHNNVELSMVGTHYFKL